MSVPIRRLLSRSTAAGLLVLALVAPGTAFAEAAPLGDRVFDAMVLRPLGFLGTTVGFGFFVCSIPLAGPSLQLESAWEHFVLQPADYTFSRDLGEF